MNVKRSTPKARLLIRSVALTASLLVASGPFAASYMILKGSGGVAPIHSEASPDAKVVTSVPIGLVVKSAGGSKTSPDGTSWQKVSYGGSVGWMKSSSTYKLDSDNSELRAEAAKPKPEPVEQPVANVLAPAAEISVNPAATTSADDMQAATVQSNPVPQAQVQQQSAASQGEANPFAAQLKKEKKIFSGSSQAIKDKLEEKQAKEKQRKLAIKRRIDWRKNLRKPAQKPLVTASVRQVLASAPDLFDDRDFASLPSGVSTSSVPQRSATQNTSGPNSSGQREISRVSGYRVQSSPLLVRAEPDTSYTPIMSLSYSDIVTRTGLVSEGYDGTLWWQIRSLGTTGWVPRRSLSDSQEITTRTVAAPVAVTRNIAPSVPTSRPLSASTGSRATWSVTGVSRGLRMRSGPGQNFQAIASIPSTERSLVSTGEVQNGWMRVYYGSSTGWVSLDFVRKN